jgi:hypothetical protein
MADTSAVNGFYVMFGRSPEAKVGRDLSDRCQVGNSRVGALVVTEAQEMVPRGTFSHRRADLRRRPIQESQTQECSTWNTFFEIRLSALVYDCGKMALCGRQLSRPEQ